MGLHAAVRARDLGASVIVIDQNFDVGGKLVHSGGWTSLGGGDAVQERDRTVADPEGLGLTAPLIKPEDLEDDPDRLFRDMTDWSVVDATGVARYRYNDRELHRAWADNAPRTRRFMMEPHPPRTDRRHPSGWRDVRARAARAIMKLADKTNIKAVRYRRRTEDPAGSAFTLQSHAHHSRGRGQRDWCTGMGLWWFCHRQVTSIQRAGKGRQVHAQPPYGMNSSGTSHSRAGVSGNAGYTPG